MVAISTPNTTAERLTSNGDSSGATSNGDFSTATAKKGNVATAIGYQSKAKGEIGSWITLTECETNCNEKGERNILDVKTFRVDGKKVKENTFYTLVNGKPIAA